MKFKYQARTKEGKIKSGEVEAPNREAALNILQKYGFFVTQLKEVKKPPLLGRKIKLFEKASQKDIVNFTRQLSIMFKSKVPLVDSLRTLALQWKKEDFKEKIMKMSEEVEGGASLSQAFSLYPDLFSDFYVAMVKSGESSGTLSESLTFLANHLERERDLKTKMRGAALYPAFVLFMIFIILGLMVFFVFPRLSTILRSGAVELPLATKITLDIADFLKNWGLILILILIIALGALFKLFRTKRGKEIWSSLSLRIPFLKGFFKKIYLARFARNLSTLISGGLPIAQALEITGEVVGNNIYKRIILKTRDEVRKGESINVVLSRFPNYMPPLVIQMVMVGEKTGTLDTTLMNVVDFYQKEVERFTETIINLLEPILIIILGIGVGIVVITVFKPLYEARMMGI